MFISLEINPGKKPRNFEQEKKKPLLEIKQQRLEAYPGRTKQTASTEDNKGQRVRVMD